VKAIVQSSNTLKISYEKLVEWGKLIKKDWLERNFKASIENISHEKLVNLLISKIHEQSTEIQMMKHIIDNLNFTVLKQTEKF
jgi:hypothetical protein